MEIDINKMYEYYQSLDPIRFKYQKLLEEWEKIHTTRDKVADMYSIYSKIQEYESSRQFAELTRKKYHHLQSNLDLVYAQRKRTDRILRIFEVVCDKIICQYINIDGIERLFSEKYADFEWEMHLGLDHDQHSMDFYRDHFIHQVKDAYSMVKMLEEGGMYSKVKAVMNEESYGKISQFVQKYLKQQIYGVMAKPVIKFGGENSHEIEDFISLDNTDILKEHYLYNIIYMSSYLAGLFHDIGYPAAASMGEYRRTIDYIAEVQHFGQKNYDFYNIMTLLQNSLLFRVVDPIEIRKRIECDKPDHGVLSALLFLLHFYENGTIHRLAPYKICAVELAGLAIYNHTNKYQVMDPLKESNYYRCVFSLNPISYLLRICDDMQEWGRIYFEISDKSNMIVCTHCHMPVIRRKDNVGKTVYRCNCGKDYVLFEPLFKYGHFPSRRIYNVTVCQRLLIDYDPIAEQYVFSLDYELDRLLHIAYINPQYAKYRIKELNHMKKLFICQEAFKKAYVDFFVTSNVILIKAMLVGKYVENQYGNIREEIAGLCKQMLEKLLAMDSVGVYGIWNQNVVEFINLIIEATNDETQIKECTPEKYIRKAIQLYMFVYVLMKLGKMLNSRAKTYQELKEKLKNSGGKEKTVQSLFGEIVQCEEKRNSDFYVEEVKLLLEDCALKATRMYDNLNGYSYYPDPYFQVFEPEQENVLYNACARFTDPEKYQPFDNQKSYLDMPLDAFTDLYYISKFF